MRLTRSTILNSLNPFITRTKLDRLCPELLAHEDVAMPTTAITHFREDVARARAIVLHADPLAATTPEQHLLRSDLLRSAWMFAVGALDAYFCDAYTDIVAATIISKSRHPAMALPG
jgi:hypothetical protein